MRILMSVAVLVSSLLVATATGAEPSKSPKTKETDDPTFLGLVYKLSCLPDRFTTLGEDKFLSTPVDFNGNAIFIDLTKRTIRALDIDHSRPLPAEFKAITWEGRFDKRIWVTAASDGKTARVVVDIAGSPRGIDGIQFAKTTRHPGTSTLFLEWGKCKSLPPT
jgi:hypothetical protein